MINYNNIGPQKIKNKRQCNRAILAHSHIPGAHCMSSGNPASAHSIQCMTTLSCGHCEHTLHSLPPESMYKKKPLAHSPHVESSVGEHGETSLLPSCAHMVHG